MLIASRHPLLLIESQDETRLMTLLRDAARAQDLVVWTWSASRGLARDGKDPQYGTRDPRRALDWVDALGGSGLFVFADIHPAFTDPQVVRAIKELAQTPVSGRTVVLTAPLAALPPELRGLALPWTLRPPSRAELAALIRRTVTDLQARNLAADLDDQAMAGIVEAVAGLSLGEAERMVQQAALRDGELTAGDVPYLRRAKAEILSADGILELIEADGATLEDVGGMEGVKHWLAVRNLAGGSPGLEAPRGILLTGVPGCGKSFLAKAVARSRAVPLILLDPARLYRPYIGESEQRLDGALSSVDAMAPAVLWIDEIEKGFATGAEADGGVSRRLLGTFLRWMQERPAGVLLIATANDVSALPPELLRRGRFDEIFFIDLPDEQARTRILAHHLAARGHDPAGFDLGSLGAASEGFSGAELESAVVGAAYRALAGGQALDTATCLAEISAVIPLSVSRAEDVAALRAWGHGRALAA